jgi:hypothetical protein
MPPRRRAGEPPHALRAAAPPHALMPDAMLPADPPSQQCSPRSRDQHRHHQSRRQRRTGSASRQVKRLNNLLGVILGDSDSTGETIDIVEHLLGGAAGAAAAEQLHGALEPLQELVATLSSSSGTAASSAPPSPARAAPGGGGRGDSDGGGAGRAHGAAEGEGATGDEGEEGSSDSSDASFHGGGADHLGRRMHARYPTNMCGGVAQAAILPPPPPFDTVHCPVLVGRPVQKACNCISAHNRRCCVLSAEGECSEMMEEEFTLARASSDDAGRMPNDSQRFRCYKKAFYLLYGTGQRHERHPLPHCIVCAIRQAWPSDTGRYTGFRAN